MLKRHIATLEEVDEKFRGLYKQATGEGETGFSLDVDETDRDRKLDEFRTNNRELHRQVQEATARLEKFKDVDPEKYSQALGALQKLREAEEKGLLDQGKLDEVVQRRVDVANHEWEKKYAALEVARKTSDEQAGAYKNRLSTLIIEGEVTKALGKVGRVRQGALDDALARAGRVWKMGDDGKLAAPDVFNEKGAPINMEEWAKKLLSDAPHLFDASKGSNATGGHPGAGTGGGAVVPNDPYAIGKNLDDIASGKTRVAM
jgi:hypothetical protein